MTILNVHVASERVLIGTDSAGTPELALVRAKDASRALAKCLVLPSGPIALAFRGKFIFGLTVFMRLAMGCFYFDDWVKALPEELLETFDKLPPGLGVNAAALPECQQLVLAGYSEQRGRMAAFAFSQETRERGFEVREILRSFAAPSIPGADAFDLSYENGHIAAARAQFAWAREHHPDAGFGGALIVTELSRTAVIQRHLLDLDADYAMAIAARPAAERLMMIGGAR
jgi:hypothetical protein